MMELIELAKLLKAELYLPAGVVGGPVDRVEPIASARPGAVTCVAEAVYERHLAATRASAVIVARRHEAVAVAQLVHRNPYYAFAKAAQVFWHPERPAAGIAAQAAVDPAAVVHPTATVMPFASVGPGARIGERVVLFPGSHVGARATVGDDSELRANAVVEHDCVVGRRVLIHAGSVIGADGFGFAPGEDGIAKFPQTARVVVGDDVEIGACSTVDRGALEDTVIGRGSKLDSHVHVGHGVVVGEHSMMCGLSGAAGSVRIGNRVIVAGHVGINNKVTIADGVIVGGFSGVVDDLSEKGTYIGFPAGPAGDWRRQVAHLKRLPQLEKRVRELERLLKGAGGDSEA